jgi:hypothetical protein
MGNRGNGANGGANGGGNRQADTAYRNCLNDRGVQISATMSTADTKIAEALKACEVLKPAATPTPSPS